MHSGPTRKSGEPYIVHPISADFFAANFRDSVAEVSAASDVDAIGGY